jgi:preprotein translocase subunit SecE
VSYGRFGLRVRSKAKKGERVARKIVDEPSEEIVANAKHDRAEKRNPLGRVALFIRQVIAELKKVVTPTRKELLSFTAVVLVFVIVMMAVVSALDTVFGFLTIWVFGDGNVAGG